MKSKACFQNTPTLKQAIRAAQGKDRADLVIKNTRFLDVFTGQFRTGDVAVKGGKIVGIAEEYVGDFYAVKNGLEEGELVVVRGNFKIDSAIQLQARPSMMNPSSGTTKQGDNELPELFASRLDLLNQRFVELSREIHKQDAGPHRSALQNFTKALAAITEDTLEEEERLSWQEFAMLLKNDAILLQEAESTKEAQGIYAELAEHFHQVRERFALQDIPAAQAASPGLQAKVGELLKGYLILQQNLAADNEQVALDSASALAPLTQSLTTALLQTGTKKAGELAARLEKTVLKLTQAQIMADLRTSFSPYSQAVVETVETFGSNDHTSWFVHFCPMAFDNTGASWLAPSEEISNPYFGAMMLRCGEVRKQLTQE